MTTFLDPQRNSKASRKERKEAADLRESAATERAVASLQRAMGKDLRKADNQERLIAKAIAESMPELIPAMDEEALAPFFFALERVATAPNRRRIAKHALRPEIVDELHAEADEEDARAAEEAAKAEAEAQARVSEKAAEQGAAAVATPKGDTPDSATSQ